MANVEGVWRSHRLRVSSLIFERAPLTFDLVPCLHSGIMIPSLFTYLLGTSFSHITHLPI